MLQNHYSTLDLPSSPAQSQALSQAEVKAAYRLALLKHHPDKTPQDHTTTTGSKPTVDDITNAYKVLSSLTLRAKYDRALWLAETSWHKDKPERVIFAGLESIDLDEMELDEAAGTWRRTCRCGHDQGFTVTEEQLDTVAAEGVLIAGCSGCSLWLRVLFAVVEDG